MIISAVAAKIWYLKKCTVFIGPPCRPTCRPFWWPFSIYIFL